MWLLLGIVIALMLAAAQGQFWEGVGTFVLGAILVGVIAGVGSVLYVAWALFDIWRASRKELGH